MRFAYSYSTGQWGDYAPAAIAWSLLGSAGLSSAFLGDGGWHTVGAGESYRYASGGDYSNWLVNGNMRFAYSYGTGQWGDYAPAAGTWSLLGSAGLSSAFLGDGSWHTVWTGVSYRYTASGDYSNWLVNGNMRFAYTYGTGQWADYAPAADEWSLLGASGLSSAYLGDGAWHTLGNDINGAEWRYSYDATVDSGQWYNTVSRLEPVPIRLQLRPMASSRTIPRHKWRHMVLAGSEWFVCGLPG